MAVSVTLAYARSISTDEATSFSDSNGVSGGLFEADIDKLTPQGNTAGKLDKGIG